MIVKLSFQHPPLFVGNFRIGMDVIMSLNGDGQPRGLIQEIFANAAFTMMYLRRCPLFVINDFHDRTPEILRLIQKPLPPIRVDDGLEPPLLAHLPQRHSLKSDGTSLQGHLSM
jgi:hypothetical protein